MTNKTIQKEVVFYLLYKSYKKNPYIYVPVHEFAAGDVHIPELHRWAFASFKCPARVTEIYKGNPGLLDRRKVKGRSGAVYYEYRIAPNPSEELIKDAGLLSFYKRIRVIPKKDLQGVTG